MCRFDIPCAASKSRVSWSPYMAFSAKATPSIRQRLPAGIDTRHRAAADCSIAAEYRVVEDIPACWRGEEEEDEDEGKEFCKELS